MKIFLIIFKSVSVGGGLNTLLSCSQFIIIYIRNNAINL